MGTLTHMLVATLLVLCSTARSLDFLKRQKEIDNTMVYTFEDIIASEELRWQPCFESFQCTNLLVPLDYYDSSAGTTNVPFVKWTSPKGVGQDILFNPGGPGASGVKFLVDSIEGFIDYFGWDYNWISFDPRGVNASDIKVNCTFPLMESYIPLGYHWVAAEREGRRCAQLSHNVKAKYVGTPAVVQDIVHFSELSAAAKGESPEDATIWYYGESYGTVIGHTLAAMYPQRIGRMISAGNVNSKQEYEGDDPSTVADTDKTFAYFFQYCYEAGPSFCAIYGNASSPEEIESKFRQTLEHIAEEPLITGDEELEFISAGDIVLVLRATLYSLRKYYRGAKIIEALYERDVAKLEFYTSSLLKHFSSGPTNPLLFITCATAAGRYPYSNFAEYKSAVKTLESESYYFGHMHGILNGPFCNGLRIIPPESQVFTAFNNVIRTFETDTPILFVNRIADPVTSLSAAQTMSEYFPGSSVLLLDSPGHGFGRVKSWCAKECIRGYLSDGIVPINGAYCKVDYNGEDVFRRGKPKVTDNDFSELKPGNHTGFWRDMRRKLHSATGIM